MMNSDTRAGVLVTLAFLATLIAGVGLGVAADRRWLHPRPFGPGRGGPPPGMFGPGPQSAEREERFRGRMLDRMRKELDLTEEQARRVDSLLHAQGEELRALREEMRPRMEAFFERTRHALDSVLTPEQRDKLSRMRPPGPPPGGPGGPGGPEGPPGGPPPP
jgi:Spy/CpxP family protein refolding chaperone